MNIRFTRAALLGGVAVLGCLLAACGSGSDPNQAPSISTIADQAIPQDTSTGALGFTVGDRETAQSSLTVAASSSDTTVVPNANIVVSGTGANRTLVVTPAPDQFGVARITLVVMDGSGLQSTSQFTLRVNDTRQPFTAFSKSAFAQVESADGVSIEGVKFNFDGDDMPEAYDDLLAAP